MKMRETPAVKGRGGKARKLRSRERKHMREHNKLEMDKKRFRRLERASV